ncbi:patatin-like phospholipase domain-containing protein 2 [Archocentrus centrarchus]|uniref:patatin-like phospholipase domain-containing protein 2 n=1 Tax=Archocentrus centrarchus TaxID=63155 RepID=UPI0011E9B9B8|nr:patatin-like phospholipase domain-containing protein 2 [Archocentrus centrarchus]
MFDLKKEWSISFAGCGFMGIYYIGATSCILERFPRFIQDASKIYGASAGALTAAVLTLGIPLEKCCADLMSIAKEARKHRLGPLHPSFNLLQRVQDTLLNHLPEDAHVRASGKLGVSLTRVSDVKNVLVSEFDSREELIQALICSCFVPFYCGIIPPTYRRVHYVDGAVTDNLPGYHLKQTITFSPYAGESDICPQASTLNFHKVHFNNISIQLNSENLYRVTSTFFPPEPEAMAEICHNGYKDALRFLQENNLISSERPMRSLATDTSKHICCEVVKESSVKAQQRGLNTLEEGHWWLDPHLIENLSVNIQKVLCEACRETRTAGGLFSYMTEYLPRKVTSYLPVPYSLPVDSVSSLAQRLVYWIPDLQRDRSRLYGMVGDIYKQALKDDKEDSDSKPPLHRSTSLPLALNLCSDRKGDKNSSSEATFTSSHTFISNTHSTSDHMLLTPPTSNAGSGFDEATLRSRQSADTYLLVKPTNEGCSWKSWGTRW